MIRGVHSDAGCKCLAVTSSFRPEAFNNPDWICDSLLNAPQEALNW